MPAPKLGFKLGFRHFKQNATKVLISIFKNRDLEIIGILISAFALYYAITANNISNTALKLAQTDTTQTAQIGRLNDVIAGIQSQNNKSSIQLDTLISISKNTRDLNNSSNDILISSDKVSNLTNKQLLLNLKNEQAALMNNRLAKESDLFAFQTIFWDLDNSLMNGSVIGIDLNSPGSRDATGKIILTLRQGFSNKIFQTDSVVKNIWYKMYVVTNFVADRMNFIRASSKEEDKKYVPALTNLLIKQYNTFLITIQNRLAFMEEVFRKENVKDFDSNPNKW
jgi:hypothetical protein